LKGSRKLKRPPPFFLNFIPSASFADVDFTALLYGALLQMPAGAGLAARRAEIPAGGLRLPLSFLSIFRGTAFASLR
jgi:hypothetical protein